MITFSCIVGNILCLIVGKEKNFLVSNQICLLFITVGNVSFLHVGNINSCLVTNSVPNKSYRPNLSMFIPVGIVSVSNVGNINIKESFINSINPFVAMFPEPLPRGFAPWTPTPSGELCPSGPTPHPHTHTNTPLHIQPKQSANHSILNSLT